MSAPPRRQLSPVKIAIAGVVAAVLAFAAMGALRKDKEPTPATPVLDLRPLGASGSAAAVMPAAGSATPRSATINLPTPPAVPGPASTGRGSAAITSPAVTYQAEARDAAWATSTQALVRARIGAIAVATIDCHTTTCKLELVPVADEQAASASIAALERRDGLAGIASEMLLGDIVTQPDGKRTITAHLRFER